MAPIVSPARGATQLPSVGCARPPAALRLTKQLARRGVRDAVADTIKEETGHFQRRLESLEAKEAFSAFLEKRKPDFSKFA